MDGSTSQAASIVEMASDLLIYNDTGKVFRGRITGSEDQIGAEGHSTTFVALSYRALLERALMGDDDVSNFEQTDQGDIAWTLIDMAQRRPGGDLGILRGGGFSTGTQRDMLYEPGQSVLEMIDAMALLEGGFDWDITPELMFEIYTPRRGASVEFSWDYGRSVKAVKRSFAASEYSNVVRVSGDSALEPVVASLANLETLEIGRWESAFGLSDVYDQQVLAAAAVGVLAQRARRPVAYSVTMTIGAWAGLQDFGPGDLGRLTVNSGRLLIDEAVRVADISLTVDDAGSEQVEVTLVPPEFTSGA